MAAPGGGAMAGLEVGRRREGRGNRGGAGGSEEGLRESESEEAPGKPEGEEREPGEQPFGWISESYGEGSQERRHERVAKRPSEGSGRVQRKNPLEKKPNWLEIRGTAERQKLEILREETEEATASSEHVVRRPTITFNLSQNPKRRSQSSVPSFSVINELAKMGDPDVLEMVQEEGRSRRSSAAGVSDSARTAGHRGRRGRGDVGGPAAWSRGSFPGRRALRETGTA